MRDNLAPLATERCSLSLDFPSFHAARIDHAYALVFLLLVLPTLGTVPLQAAESSDELLPDEKLSITQSVTEHGVTLKVVCPKVVLPGVGNYILMTVRNENDQPVSFEYEAPYYLGVYYRITLPTGKLHKWRTLTSTTVPETNYVTLGGIKKGQEYKVIVYPTRYTPFSISGQLKPGQYKLWVYWEGTRGEQR